jgi:ABC-type transport system substrate-binding protein/tRNA A-37 threonylcarbamoyl transferase component Bud32
MQSAVRTGTVIGGFRVDSLIGEGAMGAVYLAEEVATGRRVALKLLAPDLARDERFRQRFMREARVASSLDHPHIVPTVAAGEHDDRLYLAMAYVEGVDLRELLRQEGRLEGQRAVDLIAQVAEGLHAAHAAGLVHRDVKPGNILISSNDGGEHADVCDFGLARHVSSVSSLTGERGFVGTIDYVPPEQIEGGTIDGRADVYSLGCVLFECLAGERPFERESELSVVFAHLNEPPPALSDFRAELPQAFDDVFATALAKSPEDRYSTCGELAHAARAALQRKTFARRRGRRRRQLAAAAVFLLAVGGAVGGVLATGGSTSHGREATMESVALRPNALNLIDARARRVTARVPLASRRDFTNAVWDVAFAGGSIWALLGFEQRLVRVELATRKVTKVVKLPWQPGQRLAVGGGSIWVPQDLGPGVLAITARTGTIARRFEIGGGGIGGIAYGAGSLWLAQGRTTLRVDPRTGRVLRRYSAPAGWLLFADGALWAAEPGSGVVTKIDPVDNRIAARTKLHPWVTDFSVGGGVVWVSVVPDNVVFKLSEDDLSVQGSEASGADPERIAFGGGHLWIANGSAKSVSLLDQLPHARRQLSATARPTTAAYHDGVVAVAAARAPSPLPAISGDEIRISTPTQDWNYGTPDPLNYDLTSQQLLYATCASLLNYPDAAGPAGTRLMPEIAAAMPRISNGGRTYSFRIRRGFRFSPPSNEPVTAETFRHSLERELSPKNQYSPGLRFASDIVGVSAYRAGKSSQIAGIRVHENTFSITLVKPAGDFLTRFSTPAFCPVPLSIRVHSKQYLTVPPPSAGPYYVSSVQGERTVLLRNPNYAGNRPRRPERIVLTNDIPTAKAIALANSGKVDLLPFDFDSTSSLLWPNGVLDQQSGAASAAARANRQRFFLHNAPFVDYIAFNTERPLFRDARLRRAVSYALDRRALARAFADAPADSIVPPAVPGFAPGRSYPLDRADLRAARRLTAGRRHRGVLYFCGNTQERNVASIVRSDLARIGIAVSIDETQSCPTDRRYDARSRRADLILVSGMGSEARDAKPFLERVLATDGSFGSALGRGLWTSAGFRRQLERARPLRGDSRTAAYSAIVDELMREAPFAVYGSAVLSEYFSPKVGCNLFQGEYGVVDLGALCKSKT